MTTPAPHAREGTALAREPRFSLPAARIIAAVVAATGLVIGGWSLAMVLGPWGRAEWVSGLVGAGAMGVIVLIGVLIMTPWRTRPAGEWALFWLGSTVFRLVASPIVLYVIYSAASDDLSVKPFVLSVAAAYLATLLAEAVAIALAVRSTLSPADPART